jgi:hypothetical protein
MPKDGFSLFSRNPWKPLNEVVDPRAALEILEQSTHWDSCAFEDPFAAEFARHSLHSGAATPVNQGGRLASVLLTLLVQ